MPQPWSENNAYILAEVGGSVVAVGDGYQHLCLRLCAELGSGLIDQSQKVTAAAMHMAEKNVWAQRS